ncbi:MAG: EamA family transporter [Caldiserica bacterium]|nr:EamA family transporter [Caldisericota bacterium]
MTSSKRNAWGLFNLGAAATIWGSTFVVSRYALASVSFLYLVILRFACSTALFATLFLVQRPHMPRGREWWLYLGAAASGYVLSIPFQFLGTSLTNAHIGSIVTCATPLAIVVLAGLFLHEHIRLRDVLAIAIALSGVALISLEGLRPNVGVSPLHWLAGIAALVAAAVMWGLYSLFLRLITRKQSSLAATGISNALGFFILLPLFIPRGGEVIATVTTRPVLAAAIVYLGVVSTFLGFSLWTLGLQQVNSVSASSLMFFCQPLAGTILGMLVLHEHVTAQTISGSGLILAGLLVSMVRPQVNTL